MGAGKILRNTDRTHVENTDADENPDAGDKAHDVMGGPCQVYTVSGHNSHATLVRYLDIWDNVNPIEGTTEPTIRIRMPASKAFGPFNFGVEVGAIKGIKFSNGLSYACVTTAGGSIGPGAGECDVNIEAEKL